MQCFTNVSRFGHVSPLVNTGTRSTCVPQTLLFRDPPPPLQGPEFS